MNEIKYRQKKNKERSEDIYKRRLRRGGHMIEGLNGQPLTSEEQGVKNAKDSILVIERFMFALAKATIPLQQAEEMVAGAKFLQAMHARLLAQIGPEEVEKMKEQFKAPPAA